MLILKLKLFQETVCYKKPFSFKVAETYPLPPYSTVIGMFHKILDAKNGEYFPMNISIQGENEGIFSNYQTLRMYKSKTEVTSMPRNVHQLLNVNLIIHVKSDDEVINKIINNIKSGTSFTLGRNEDLVRVDEIKIIQDTEPIETYRLKYNAYISKENLEEDESGINYRLNTIYTIDKNNLRQWKKVDVKYVEAGQAIEYGIKDQDGDNIFWYMEEK